MRPGYYQQDKQTLLVLHDPPALQGKRAGFSIGKRRAYQECGEQHIPDRAQGIAQGLSTQNKTAVLALILISLSLTLHYFAHWAYPVVINRPSIKWSHVFSGIAMTAITVGLVWWLWVICGKPIRLP
ncbi:MAG TPA: hypothetical protein VKZ53_17075 [Candidatus Angelobacter sp.]|nr:hypothetical protein [Candidatus Angelobacter sp.]